HQPVDALLHTADERLFIPSREEAGQEDEAVAGRPQVKDVPLNPVTTRGQDPELYWLHKYGADDADQRLRIDIRSLYRHEHIEPERLIARLYALKNRDAAQNELFTNELHGNPLAIDELDKPASYYKRHDTWRNRLIQGDSLLVMTSLLEREGMAGAVQCIYIDPPYGIKYGSNWQMRVNDRNVKDGADEHLSGEPEVIKAFRDTWELGIHSYLSYLRDRLLVAKELLSNSGSCFVQISDENVHLVRCLMDEVFGSENFVAQITFTKTSSATVTLLPGTADYIIWYARDKASCKYRTLYREKKFGDAGADKYDQVELPDGTRRAMTRDEKLNPDSLPASARIYRLDNLLSQAEGREKGEGAACWFPVEMNGREFLPNERSRWKTNEIGMDRLQGSRRIQASTNSLGYVRFLDDFPAFALSNVWTDIGGIQSRLDKKVYNVQTSTTAIQRCILMTTDPGDLVLDPTCGSGTTAHVAEQWGRRWITSDTSRIALNIAKTRLMTATYPWYELADKAGGDIRHGFDYKKVPHVTLKSIANGEPPDTETLYDQPKEDKKKLRVAGPFTVETLQGFEPLAPEGVATANTDPVDSQRFADRVFEHLKHAGIKNGRKNEMAVFNRVDAINEQMGDGGALHAEGWYADADGAERKAYFHIGPQFGTVSKKAVNDAILACRRRADGDWLVILGFGFESDVDNRSVTLKVGSFEVTKVRMHDDLMQDGLIKKDKKAASFVTIGEPDIATVPATLADGSPGVAVEIRGLDLYDPMTDEVKERSAADISYWMVDERYDGANFVATQVFFCGGDKDEFDKWKRGLSALAVASAKAKAEKTLKLEIDDEAFERVYGLQSHPIRAQRGQRVAVRVISQFGEECTKVLVL
ncbi:MAG TPA: site-specific DNA-methyltransferase, partial [Burkholderiaceae bacterium]|nr:site-specific DNA-methyltransferase [Burkholderiaceae bacterium]